MGRRAEGVFKKGKEIHAARRRAQRTAPPASWVKINKDYGFDGPNGKETLSDLFEGRGQLIIYHFMFGPDWDEGCPSCSLLADTFDGATVHLNHRDVTLTAVSRTPFDKLEAYKKRMG